MADSPVEKPTIERQTSEMPTTIAKALIKIQKELEPLKKSATNGSYDSTYVPLEVVTKEAHRLLSAEGVGITQSPVTDDKGHAALETMLFTGSGQTYKRVTKLAMQKVDPQAHGSAITYTRRYALMSIIGFTGEGEDDDGNTAKGVFRPVEQDQIDHLETLLKHMKWPKKSIADEVFKLKSFDGANLAIANYEKIVSEMMRDNESKANATAIEVSTEDDVIDESSPHATLQARITKLGLAGKAAENKFVFNITNRPFLNKVKDPEDLKMLSVALDKLESGERHLPDEFYPPLAPGETRIVEEAVDQ